VEALAAELAFDGIETRIELTDRTRQLVAGTGCYDARFLISAVSTPDVIDIDRVAPRTVLVDDGQPNCWSRGAAWRRVGRFADIAPCEAGLVDVSSLNYWSYFPFQFAPLIRRLARPWRGAVWPKVLSGRGSVDCARPDPAGHCW
jgi:hypothetical protein